MRRLPQEYKAAKGRAAKEDHPEWNVAHKILLGAGIPTIEQVGGDVDELNSNLGVLLAEPLPDGIRVDDTRYDTVRYVDTWPDSYRATGQVGPVGALTVDGGWNDPAGRRDTPPDPAIASGEALARLLERR